MKKKIVLILFVILIITQVVFSKGVTEVPQNENDTVKMVTIIDNNGFATEVKENPQRVVITDIYPLASVLTVFLDSSETLVGIHPVSMSAAKNGLLGQLYPDYLNIDTNFMSAGELNVEQLLMLKPDVVLYNASKKAQGELLRNAGIKAVGVSAVKWDYDVLETYRQWTNILSQLYPSHSQVSKKVDEYSKKTKALIEERVSTLSNNQKKDVLFLFHYDDKKIITSGKHFFGQWWANAVGARNIAESIQLDNSNAIITMEQVYKWNPDIIFITNFTSTLPEDLYNNSIGNDNWTSVKAVENKQVFKLPLGSYRSYTPGVDTPVTLLWMAKKVYPNLFEDIDIFEETRNYYKMLYNVVLSDTQINTMYNSVREGAKGYTPNWKNN